MKCKKVSQTTNASDLFRSRYERNKCDFLTFVFHTVKPAEQELMYINKYEYRGSTLPLKICMVCRMFSVQFGDNQNA
jgi:hypothetical protein